MINTYIDGIQTGENELESDIATLRIRQSTYGSTNKEVHLELFTFAYLDTNPVLVSAQFPNARLTLDEVGARKLILEMAKAFKLPCNILGKQRTKHEFNSPGSRPRKGKYDEEEE